MPPPPPPPQPPAAAPRGGEAFAVVAARLREATGRPEVVLEEIPAPGRLAPHAVAFAAEVLVDGEEVAHGRLVLLHDPAGQEGWAGDTRLVTIVQAPVEPEMAGDPLLGAVAWTWLADSLTARGAASHAAGGTVTRTASSAFGDLARGPDDPPGAGERAEVEIRASWSPGHQDHGGLTEDLVAHLDAWCDLLCTVAGLPPPGVAAVARLR